MDTEPSHAARVAEIIATRAGGGIRRGSGLLVRPGRVLTAAHVVADAARVRVRFDADRPGERTLDAEVTWRHDGVDAAVVSVDPGAAGGEQPPWLPPFGRIGERDAVLRCSAVGFPLFKLRRDADGSSYRDTAHAVATCAVLSNRREGTLDLSTDPPAEPGPAVSSAGPAPPAGSAGPVVSPWSGMSGAVVLSRGHVIGVVAEHHRTDGPGRLAASRVDRWAERLTPAELHALEACLDTRLDPAALPDVLPPAASALAESVYRAQLRDIAPLRLDGREEELAELVAFCGGGEPYRWLQAPPWAGKTALAAWFALHPPRGVVPVWFFITARFAGQSDSGAFTEALVHQFAAIAGRAPSAHALPMARDGERRLLLEEAARRVARDGGTLLLVVDGLDEDQSTRPGGTGPSIASLLPPRLPPQVRVLVTSRPNPGLPHDVPGGHPLRNPAVVTPLRTAEAARHTEDEARWDLSHALYGEDELGRELVGLFTAARGSLTPRDLHELTGRPYLDLRKWLGSAFGRLLRVRDYADALNSGSSGDRAAPRDDPDATRGHLFAHETLYTAALGQLGGDIEQYRARLHRWAARYAERGWPRTTPPYLLRPYSRLVTGLGDAVRAARLSADVRRHDRLRDATGSDAAALAEIDTAIRLLRDTDPDDLAHLAPLAAARDLLAGRNRALPPELPPVVAESGDLLRAEGLARSVYDLFERAMALVGVARVLARRGDRERAVELVREAEELAVHLPVDGSPPDGNPGPLHRGAAVVLAACGRADEALALVERLKDVDAEPVFGDGPDGPDGTPEVVAVIETVETSPEAAEALAEVAAALRPHDARTAARLLDEAEAAAAGWASPVSRTPVLVAVARACAGHDETRRDRLLDGIEAEAEAEARAGAARVGPLSVTVLAVPELRDARPERAARLARALARCADSSGSGPEPGSEPLTVFGAGIATGTAAGTEAVVALALGGLPEEAVAFAARSPAERSSWAAWRRSEAIAGAWVRRGRLDRALSILDDGAVMGRDADRLRLALVRALAQEGHPEEALRCAAGLSRLQDSAAALSTVAGHLLGTDRPRATELLDAAAEALYGPEAGAGLDDAALVRLAEALAAVGEYERAGRSARATGEPALRWWALAETAVRRGATDSAAALRTLEAALETSGGGGGPPEGWARIAVAVALERLGAGARARELADTLTDDQRTVHAALLSSLLWDHDRAAAESLAVSVESRCTVARSPDEDHPDHAVSTLPFLLAALGYRSPARAQRMAGHLARAVKAASPIELHLSQAALRAVVPLLPGEPRREVSELLGPPDPRDDPWPEPGDYGPAALLRAAEGDFAGAEELAREIHDPGERGAALTELAAVLVGSAGPTLAIPGDSALFGQAAWITRRWIGAAGPPAGGRTPERTAQARRLLGEVLAAEGWYHALPLLAELEPDAVRAAADVVFARPDPDDTAGEPGAGRVPGPAGTVASAAGNSGFTGSAAGGG
ncbi:trypsin-like peptidase domain-containing protein [Streptomyces sp. WAC 00631]|uniref:trypsin-like peptidase domain-containing protein n=1 Tax=Streptomyces sp. WAC 00631 TaxID=2203201 RepID=UPI000F76D41A|nr:trypsin-like peptidase domain-containing protein [Streptomyces sp. WAC 00631]MCC5036443.1 trypsin-like peptidase domain-containing protein [Streptomyces sp. WAC 00631]